MSEHGGGSSGTDVLQRARVDPGSLDPSSLGPSSLDPDGLGGVALLDWAVECLVAEVPAEIPARRALARARSLLVARERLQCAVVAAVRDVEVRELFALDAAGSTRGWLRGQIGGDQGQLTLGRRLAARTRVAESFAAGDLSVRAVTGVCAALERVPAQVPEPALVAVVTDGLASLLAAHTGRELYDQVAPSPAALAVQTELEAVQAEVLAATADSPAARLEPAFLLLARHLAPGGLDAALSFLLDALAPHDIDLPEDSEFFLDLRPVLDGEWDLRGHLDPETGTLLARELERREVAARRIADAERAAATVRGQDEVDGRAADLAAFDAALDAALDAAQRNAQDPHGPAPRAFRSTGQHRHDALTQLLRDAAGHEAGSGRPAPTALTVIATLDAVQGRLGALPGALQTPGGPVSLRAETLRRLGCHGELDAVLLDALGNPVGASGTHRNANRKQRAALQARWGSSCAVTGCTRPATVPHHVRPWWLSRETVQRDLVPICEPDHRDLHEGHRTLRLEDGRLIDELGWAGETA